MLTKSKQFMTAAVAVAILFTMMTIVSAWGTPADPPPYDLDYAKSCNDVLPFLVLNGDFNATIDGMYSEKYDIYNEGQYDIEDNDGKIVISVWVSTDDNDKLYISAWESYNVDVQYVITKGGTDILVYQYDGMMDEDCDLMNPKTGAEFENMSGLSNFSFYWTPKPEETTAEETTTEATTAEETTTEATTAEATTEVIVITEETQPLAEATTVAATKATAETLLVIEDEIPQTGQSGNSVVIGSTLLALAASLFFILRRKKNYIE